MGRRSCHESKRGEECCGCCEAPKGSSEQLGEEFRKAFEKCRSEEEAADLRFHYLSAHGLIHRLLQSITPDFSKMDHFKEEIFSVFALKIYVRSLFYINLFPDEDVKAWIAGEGSTANVLEVTDKSVSKIVDEFEEERSGKSPFDLMGLYHKYFGPTSKFVEAWDGLDEAPHAEALKKGVNLIKAEGQIEALFYVTSRAIASILGSDPSIAWSDLGVYRAHNQFMTAISSCESNDEARALYNAYLGNEGVFAKRLAQFSKEELLSNNYIVDEWVNLREHVAATFKQLGIKAAKV